MRPAWWKRPSAGERLVEGDVGARSHIVEAVPHRLHLEAAAGRINCPGIYPMGFDSR